ncbi:MAG TPA: benzoate-CoA ligase family protein [Rubricoccaceae bacterium]|nr:benzoate-CoA ligase family protein [Rubricoccaceae bacterium]
MAHVDTFARDHLPPQELWPDLLLPEGSVFDYPERLNCAVELLDRMIEAGHGDRPLVHFEGGAWTYDQFRQQADRIAHVLVDDLGLVPGERVLLHGPNTPLFAASWFAIVKAGGIVVATMPLLRAGELAYTLDRARIRLALCHTACAEALDKAREQTDVLERALLFASDDADGLEARMAAKPDRFEAVDTAADDVVLIAFTSGTTGKAKATVHFHRDVLAICDAFPRSCMDVRPDDVFTGSPPLAFTFGLGGLLLFPMRFGASTVFPAKPGVDGLLETIRAFRATTCFTSPTAYRAMLGRLGDYDVSSLRACVSAGEPLPAPTSEAWHDATGIRIVDGIGSTEMLHIFVSAPAAEQRPGATGKPIPGYEARVVDEAGNPVPPGTVGRLAVRGPTGCRYLDDDDRQREYVRDGWNYPGDAYLVDDDGYFHYQARTDDLIISGGYNIAGLEVESALLRHPAVAECGVIGVPDELRGQVVKAFVVLRDGHAPGDALVQELQDFVKAEIAPYKYPRAIQFMDALPRTQTGKLQRFRLREMEGEA